MAIVYKTAGPWGAGTGANLSAAQGDDNFWTLFQDIQSLQAGQFAGIDYFNIPPGTNQLYVHLTDHTVLGPYLVPIGVPYPTGIWQPNQNYNPYDLFSFENSLYMVIGQEVSGSTFNPANSNYRLLVEAMQGEPGDRGPPGIGEEGDEGQQGRPGPRGNQGEQGIQGVPGAPGTNTILHGVGSPDPHVGNFGDFYIDYVNWIIYGPQESGGVWPAGHSMIGPRGQAGRPGLDGEEGDDGTQGLRGLRGPMGLTGEGGTGHSPHYDSHSPHYGEGIGTLAVEDVATITSSGGSAIQPIVSTSGADRIVVLFIAVGSNTSLGARSVSTITDVAGLIWHKRTAYATASVLNAGLLSMEIWWTYAPVALISDIVTVTLSGTADNYSVCNLAVSGVTDLSSPWDTNTSIPAEINGTTSLPTQVEGVSTNAIDTVTFGFWSTRSDIGTDSGRTAETGYTLDCNVDNSGGSLWNFNVVEHKIVTAPQSGVTVSFAGANYNDWAMIVDAIRA